MSTQLSFEIHRRRCREALRGRPAPAFGRTGLSILLALTSAVLLGCAGTRTVAQSATTKDATPNAYLFAWPDFEEDRVDLRGGTTTGAPIQLSEEPSADWSRLQQTGLSDRERDQAAIRALGGDYRAAFDFLEVVLFGDTEGPATPYRSWGTERVFVIEDRPGFVSLQHVMVMSFVDEQGEVQGPFVQKHWRQDWTWEPESVLLYRGLGEWRTEPLAREERAGAWSQTVYQVDDTPRYTLVGRWSHDAVSSVWTSRPDWRPLPRRESSVRTDYDVLDGAHRITVLPLGWVHEQENLKRVLDAPGVVDPARPILAREIGVNRYDRLDDFDFSAGAAYWSKTEEFWALVRQSWNDRLARSQTIEIRKACAGTPVFVSLFELAASQESGPPTSPDVLQERIDEVLDCATSAPADLAAAP